MASDLVDPARYPDSPHIAPNHIESGTGRLLPYATIADDGVTSPKHRFRSGQVLYSKIRPYLAKVILVDFDGLCSADMYPIDTELEPRFLKWWMLTNEFTRHAAGEQARTVLPKINVRALSALPVPVPPMPEQRRIVEILEDHFSHLDASRQSLERALHRAEAFSASTAVHALGPVQGDPMSLGAVSTSVRNGVFVSRAGTIPDGVPILRISAVRPLQLDIHDIRYSGKSTVQLSEARGLLSAGELLFTRYNGNVGLVGACAVVGADAGPLTYPDKLIRVVLDEHQAHPEYVALACTYGPARQQIRTHVKTTAGQAGISGRDLKGVQLVLPALNKQVEIAAKVDKALDSTRRLRTQVVAANKRAESLRRALMSAAFTGRLADRSSDDEIVQELADA